MYHRLVITAANPTTEVWLGDDEGMFVAKGVGVLDEGLMPGDYVVNFIGHEYPIRRRGVRHPIHLDRDMSTTEEELTS